MKKVILIGIGIMIFLGIVTAKPNKTTDKSDKPSVLSPTATEQPIIAVTDSEREIFYKCFEYEWNLPTVPIGDKSRHNKAVSLTAEEFNISTDEVEKIYEKVSKAKPSDKEIEIYEALEKRTNEAIENDSLSKPFKEDAVNKEIAKKYDISTTKLMAIYILVQSDNEYQKQRESKIAQENRFSHRLKLNKAKSVVGFNYSSVFLVLI